MTDGDLPGRCSFRNCENQSAPHTDSLMCLSCAQLVVDSTLRSPSIRYPEKRPGPMTLCTAVHPDHPNAACWRYAPHEGRHLSVGGLKWPEQLPRCDATYDGYRCSQAEGHTGRHTSPPGWRDESDVKWENFCDEVWEHDELAVCGRPAGHTGVHTARTNIDPQAYGKIQEWGEPAEPGPAEVDKPDCWTASWCPQCGPDVGVDEDGLCNSCGSTAIGEGAERAAKLEKMFRELAPIIEGVTGYLSGKD